MAAIMLFNRGRQYAKNFIYSYFRRNIRRYYHKNTVATVF